MQQERPLEEKIKPIVEETMHKFLGVHVAELETDISDRIRKSPLWEFTIDTRLPYKQAKRLFKRGYLLRLLQTHFGNVAEVARMLAVDRRTVHRLISKLKISVKEFRKELHRAEYIKTEAVKGMIENVLESYKAILHPEKVKSLYEHASELSRSIVKELPEQPLTLKQAEKEFDRRYISQVLREMNNNITHAAKRIGLRFESLHRKLKSLNLV